MALDNKVDSDLFDNEISNLRELISMESESKEVIIKSDTLNTPAAALFSPKEVNKLKELMEKVP